MKIGIDCRTILNPLSGEGAGVGHYTHYLVKNLLKVDHKNDYVLFFDSAMKDTSQYRRENSSPRYFPFSQYRRFLPFAYSHILISGAINRENLDLYHAPANVIPLGYSGPSVVTIHDLAIYQNPSWFPSQVFSTRLLVPKTLRRARSIIAVSESTAEDLRELFNVPEDKLEIIYEGVDTAIRENEEAVDVKKKFNLPDRYLCFVGTLEPRKNLIRLIQAYADLKAKDDRLANIPIILAGKRGWQSEDIFKTITELKLEKSVRNAGYVTKNEKLELMKQAAAFVFPSSYEGFGLPVLEAMALGTPVLTSNLSSLPEIVGNAAYQVNPEDTYAIVEGLQQILFNDKLRTKLKERGPIQAKKFTWEKVALRTVALYEKVGQRSNGYSI